MKYRTLVVACSLSTAVPGFGQSTRQALDDAWWTGPMESASAATLPPGHFLVEPYFYDVISAHSHGFTSRTYLIYGLVDRVAVGVIPTAGFNRVSDGPSSSGVGLGDVTAQAQYELTRFHEGGWVPTISVVAQETFPTGRYDRLGSRPSNGFGSGAYTTTMALYSQTYAWLPNGRILRLRLDVSQVVFSSTVPVAGVSVYGTTSGFRGQVKPGPSTFVDLGQEYSMTRHWVLALDATYGWNGNTRVAGSVGSGTSEAIGFAPAVEYNLTANVGVLLGARVLEIGRRATNTITPVVAINVVR